MCGMSDRRPRGSRILVVLLALAVLGALAGFSLLDRLADGGHGEDKEGALPEGFSRVPEDVFFERVFGAQKAGGSWQIEQVQTRGGQPMSSYEATSEIVNGGLDTDVTVSWPQGEEVVDLEVRVIDGIYYVKGFETQKPWWKVDPTSDPVALGTAQQIDRYITQVTDAAEIQPLVEKVTLVGPDNIDGITTAHYRVDIAPAADLIKSAPKDSSTIVDVWVDAEDRPVRSVTTVTWGEEELVTTTDFRKYGEDFPLEAPAAAEVTTERPPMPTGANAS